MIKPSLAVIILTHNEELNLERCLKSVADLAQEIFVVDSYSTDKTLEIAKKFNAKTIQHPFKNQAEQFNWALDNLDIKSDWILKLDADEEILPELKEEIVKTLPNAEENITGFCMKRRVYFMGRWIKHGGYYPAWFLRLWRNGKGRSEERKMDEHIVLLEGESAKFQNDFIDNNKKNLKDWILKHRNYATREAEEVLSNLKNLKPKQRLYYKFPAFIRAFFYFLYRYFLQLGFLDGVKGTAFHVLQGFWYRFLVDVRIFQMRGNDIK